MARPSPVLTLTPSYPMASAMTYPPKWRQVSDEAAALDHIVAQPFAHLVTNHDGLRATRIPFALDAPDHGRRHLRGHLNASNPQVGDLDGASVLVIFSGPSTYVSPNWRIDKLRAGTFDYEEVQVRGTVRVINDIDFFRRLIDDLSSLLEPRFSEAGKYPIWRTSMAAEGYIERLFPQINAFRIEIESMQMISKLHQQFPEGDRISIAQHLSRCRQEDSRLVADKIWKDVRQKASRSS